MRPFRNRDELVKILSALWDEIFNTPEITRKVAAEKLIVKFRLTDFGMNLFVDLTGDNPRYYWDSEDDQNFDVEMILSSETSHQFWMQKLNVPIAIATRQIVAKGSVQKALKLIPALKPAFAFYSGILAQMGREDLLQMKLAKKKKRKFKLLKKAPMKIASPECPVPYAKNLENALLPTAEKVAEKIERALA